MSDVQQSWERATVKKRGSTSPLAVLGAAFGAGYLLAKAIYWRGHAHPRG